MLTSLSDGSTGRYLVATASGSLYRLDLDRRVMSRVPEFGVESRLHRLRRDGEDVDLLELVQCEVGKRMILRINLAAPGVWMTTRASTEVKRIENLAEEVSGS
ncbi:MULTISPECIES: hypothetical protein [unclassified Cryobacterium]|uniref:hypothetical protein n=1 Tax=unclassified Cryobacterium TaxID=2649013 RepID=UPI002AB3CEF2|nr:MULTISPECIES: hypothetical protein [unclassified Cryobacterium]MDY7528151.1 hypothetical protein [Cryobacterium sp. 10C2]MDY7556100.1 hypothetical protein [Cryobacterium sp. 10C3]MEB0289350.1 hypothetical protein [Cryobacterium sp. 10C2]